MKLKPEQLQQVPSLLRSLALFAGASDEQIQALVSGLDYLEYPKGKVLLMEQEINRTLFILSQGVVGIWKRVSGEKKQMAVLKAPDFFGEMSIFTESPATALVKVEEDCKVFALSKAAFDAAAQKNPTLTALIQKNIQDIKAKRPVISAPKPTE